MEQGTTTIALAGLGGNNAHGAGFLAAAQQVAEDRDAEGGFLPGLKMISCTSGAIASTATYLRGGDLRDELKARIAAVERPTAGLPGGPWTAPLRSAVVTIWTGVPGVFGGCREAYTEHLMRSSMRSMLRAFSGKWWSSLPTTDDVLDLALPARIFVPKLSEEFFEQTAATFNSSPIGVTCNSFDPRAGIEYLYVNEVGLRHIQQHHDAAADYGRSKGRTVYEPITSGGIRDALWLFYYGFETQTRVDGAYARSIILDELTFADRIWVVKPINDRWLGRLPGNLLEVLDMQTELWMGTSYREQVRAINLVNRLGDDGRKALSAGGTLSAGGEGKGYHRKGYHHIDLETIEIEMQRGFFTYFLEEMAVFEKAYNQAYARLVAVTP